MKRSAWFIFQVMFKTIRIHRGWYRAFKSLGQRRLQFIVDAESALQPSTTDQQETRPDIEKMKKAQLHVNML